MRLRPLLLDIMEPERPTPRPRPRPSAVVVQDLADRNREIENLIRELNESLRFEDEVGRGHGQGRQGQQDRRRGSLVGCQVRVTARGRHEGAVAEVVSRKGTYFWNLRNTTTGEIFYKMARSFHVISEAS
jgi:hypothetical protein